MDERPPNANGPPEGSEEDDLLEALARVVRDDEMTDSEHMERLRRLAAGELTGAELAELRAEAESSEEAARDLEAFSPLGEEFQESLVQRLQAGAVETNAEVVSIDRRPPDVPNRHRTRTWLALAASLVLVVSLSLLLRSPAPDLPDYVATLSDGVQSTRGGDGGDGGSGVERGEELPTFAPGTLFRAAFTPGAAYGGELDFEFYFTNSDGELIHWEGYERDGAAFEIARDAGDLPLRPGVWTLVFVYGLDGRLPEPQTAEDLDAESKWWTTRSVTFRVLADEAASTEPPLEVLYAGCAEVRPGPICVPQEGLTLWVRSLPRAEITARTGARTLDPRVQVDGGWQIRPRVTAADGAIEIAAELDQRSSRTFRLRLGPSSLPEWLQEARRRWQSGDTDGLRQELEARYEESADDVRGWLAFMLAYLPPDVPAERRTELLEEAVALQRQNGQLVEWFSNLGVLLHADLSRRRYGDLRRRLDQAMPIESDYPAEAQLVAGFYRGHLDSAIGNPRGALAHRRAVEVVARRVNQIRFLAAAHTELAETLYLLGRVDEAERLFARTVSAEWFQDLSACYRANVLVSRSWTHLLAEGPPEAVFPGLQEAEALTREGGCTEPLPLNLRFNRALALHLEGRDSDARRELVEIESQIDDATTKQRLWWHEINGRIDLAEGDAESAARHARRIEELADLAFEPRGRWRGLVLRAAALDALGATDDALTAYSAAELLLEERSFEVPLDEGRGRFLADRQDAVRRHLDLLLRSGRVDQAFEVARRSRSWELRTIRSGHRLANLTPQQQLAWDRQLQHYLELRRKAEAGTDDDWRLAKNDLGTASSLRAEAEREAREALDLAFRQVGAESHGLPLLDAGELALAFHPLQNDGWVAFGATISTTGSKDEIRYRRFELTYEDLGGDRRSAGPALTDLLLEPFRTQIESARQIRILTVGALQTIDFHALPWDGDVLLAAKPVVYGLDVRTEPAPGTPASTGDARGALVVGDPRLDLPAARREAQIVHDVLVDNGQETRLLLGLEAGREELRTGLPAVDHFHYAGHAVADAGDTAAGGSDGWESALLLASGQSLRLGDVLALDGAPDQVVLSSCESARGASAEPMATLGLAEAFLVAGSSTVVASLRPVGDRDTEAFFRRVYSAYDPQRSPGGLADDMRAAQLAWRAEDPAADWQSFRILVP